MFLVVFFTYAGRGQPPLTDMALVRLVVTQRPETGVKLRCLKMLVGFDKTALWERFHRLFGIVPPPNRSHQHQL